jgi:hypothetical protein
LFDPFSAAVLRPPLRIRYEEETGGFLVAAGATPFSNC